MLFRCLVRYVFKRYCLMLLVLNGLIFINFKYVYILLRIIVCSDVPTLRSICVMDHIY